MPKIVIPRTNDFREVDAWRNKISKGTRQSSFSVYKTTNQTIPDITWTKIVWEAEEFDTNKDFANSVFTPTIKGKYLFTASLRFQGLGDGTKIYIGIYKNGENVRQRFNYCSLAGAAVFVSGALTIDANGTTDYFEVWGYHDYGSSRLVPGGDPPFYSSFQGHRIPFS
jgi:hypothetical protein